MNNPDTRWLQRLSNFEKALSLLEKAVQLSEQRPLSDLEEQGLIQAFEFTFELAWSLMRDWFEFQGNSEITGSRDAIREAFKAGLIADGEAWMEAIKARNKSSHTYNERTATEIRDKIIGQFIHLFRAFFIRMESLKNRHSSS